MDAKNTARWLLPVCLALLMAGVFAGSLSVEPHTYTKDYTRKLDMALQTDDDYADARIVLYTKRFALDSGATVEQALQALAQEANLEAVAWKMTDLRNLKAGQTQAFTVSTDQFGGPDMAGQLGAAFLRAQLNALDEGLYLIALQPMGRNEFKHGFFLKISNDEVPSALIGEDIIEQHEFVYNVFDSFEVVFPKENPVYRVSLSLDNPLDFEITEGVKTDNPMDIYAADHIHADKIHAHYGGVGGQPDTWSLAYLKRANFVIEKKDPASGDFEFFNTVDLSQKVRLDHEGGKLDNGVNLIEFPIGESVEGQREPLRMAIDHMESKVVDGRVETVLRLTLKADRDLVLPQLPKQKIEFPAPDGWWVTETFEVPRNDNVNDEPGKIISFPSEPGYLGVPYYQIATNQLQFNNTLLGSVVQATDPQKNPANPEHLLYDSIHRHYRRLEPFADLVKRNWVSAVVEARFTPTINGQPAGEKTDFALCVPKQHGYNSFEYPVDEVYDAFCGFQSFAGNPDLMARIVDVSKDKILITFAAKVDEKAIEAMREEGGWLYFNNIFLKSDYSGEVYLPGANTLKEYDIRPLTVENMGETVIVVKRVINPEDDAHEFSQFMHTHDKGDPSWIYVVTSARLFASSQGLTQPIDLAQCKPLIHNSLPDVIASLGNLQGYTVEGHPAVENALCPYVTTDLQTGDEARISRVARQGIYVDFKLKLPEDVIERLKTKGVELVGLREKTRELTQELAERDQRIVAQKSAIEDLLREKHQLSTRLREAKAQIAGLDQEVLGWIEEWESSQRQCEELQESLIFAGMTIDVIKDHVEVCQFINQAQEKLFKTRMAKKDATLQAMVDGYIELNLDYLKTVTELGEAKIEIAGLNVKNALLQRGLEAARIRLQATIAVYEVKIADTIALGKVAEAAALEDQKKKYEAELANLEEAHAKRVEGLQQQITDLGALRDRLQAQCEAQEGRINELCEAAEKVKGLMLLLELENTKLAAELKVALTAQFLFNPSEVVLGKDSQFDVILVSQEPLADWKILMYSQPSIPGVVANDLEAIKQSYDQLDEASRQDFFIELASSSEKRVALPAGMEKTLTIDMASVDRRRPAEVPKLAELDDGYYLVFFDNFKQGNYLKVERQAMYPAVDFTYTLKYGVEDVTSPDAPIGSVRLETIDVYEVDEATGKRKDRPADIKVETTDNFKDFIIKFPASEKEVRRYALMLTYLEKTRPNTPDLPSGFSVEKKEFKQFYIFIRGKETYIERVTEKIE